MKDHSGRQFGHYRLERLLSEGSFAQVYLATHLHLGTRVAVKVLHQIADQGAVEQFRQEARIIASLVHPHIVRVLDFGLHEDHLPYLVMDYLPGGSLRQRYPRGSRLPLSLALNYAHQVAEALQYAHEQRLVHRDVKPENMLLQTENTVLLADFGVATIAASTQLQTAQDMAGTITYMAPEQIQGYPRPESDQYGLACVLYEWLCGTPPFTGNFTEIAAQHCTASPAPLRRWVPNLPSEVEEILQRALAKDWRARFESVIAFTSALLESTTETMRASPYGESGQLFSPWPQPSAGMAFSALAASPLLPALPAPGATNDPATSPDPGNSPSAQTSSSLNLGEIARREKLARRVQGPQTRDRQGPSRQGSKARQQAYPSTSDFRSDRLSVGPSNFPLNYLPLMNGKLTQGQAIALLLYTLLLIVSMLPLFLLSYLQPSLGTTQPGPAWARYWALALLVLLPAALTLAGKIFGGWRGLLVGSLFIAVLWCLNVPLEGRGLFPTTWPSAIALAGWPLGAAVTGWLVRNDLSRSFGRAFNTHLRGLLIMVVTFTVGFVLAQTSTKAPLSSRLLLEEVISLYCCIFPIMVAISATIASVVEAFIQIVREHQWKHSRHSLLRQE